MSAAVYIVKRKLTHNVTLMQQNLVIFSVIFFVYYLCMFSHEVCVRKAGGKTIQISSEDS